VFADLQLFDWEAHLKHIYQPDDMEVKIQAMSWSFDYGFEYQGSCQRSGIMLKLVSKVT